MKKLVLALALALSAVAVPLESANADGALTASVSIASVTYNGTTGCIEVPVTLNVSGGVSNGFAYWTTENETLVGPTSFPTAPGFYFDNEQAPGSESITMCAWADHAGTYTYSADVWFKNWSDEGGEQYVGRVSGSFNLNLASSKFVKLAPHKWQVRIVGQAYLVNSPKIYLQKLKSGKWRNISSGLANSAGKFSLKKRAPGKYRLLYKGDGDIGLAGSTSKVFRRP
jgi:hypothetical protein